LGSLTVASRPDAAGTRRHDTHHNLHLISIFIFYLLFSFPPLSSPPPSSSTCLRKLQTTSAEVSLTALSLALLYCLECPGLQPAQCGKLPTPKKMDTDHIPPPPYSETDPATSQVDNASVATSSVDETIYTPPFSPTGSVHHGQTVGDSCDHVSSSSATAYFESRPVLRPASGTPEIHSITISARTEPKDLPYPANFLSRDCTEQDWATFLNYLLPCHLAEVNNEVADRKLQAELLDESMHKLGLGQEDRSDTSEVNAQLEHLRQQSSPSIAEKLRMIESTISEWNEGFFRPRGLQITTIYQNSELAAGEETSQMPGSWIPWEEDGQPESSRGNQQSRRGFLGLGRNPFMDAGSQGFRMGPIVVSRNLPPFITTDLLTNCNRQIMKAFVSGKVLW
jgi:hypothetical protein